jgi:hypothetical protein
MPRSAPFPAKKQAMEADDFLSAPWLPSPINSCNNKQNPDNIWWRVQIMELTELAQVVTFLTCTQKVPSLNPGQEIRYHD